MRKPSSNLGERHGVPFPPPALSDRRDVVVIGGGIVGLATAYRLLEQRPDLRLTVVEKEPELATHQTGHNSGVLHAGLYYAPGSLKATLCREGKAEVEAFAAAHAIPVERCGKLVVALDDSELPRLEAVRERAEANGVPGLEAVGPERIREIEPHAAGSRGLWSPETAIIDFRRVALALADEIRARGGDDHDRLAGVVDRRPRRPRSSSAGRTGRPSRPRWSWRAPVFRPIASPA